MRALWESEMVHALLSGNKGPPKRDLLFRDGSGAFQFGIAPMGVTPTDWLAGSFPGPNKESWPDQPTEP